MKAAGFNQNASMLGSCPFSNVSMLIKKTQRKSSKLKMENLQKQPQCKESVEMSASKNREKKKMCPDSRAQSPCCCREKRMIGQIILICI